MHKNNIKNEFAVLANFLCIYFESQKHMEILNKKIEESGP